MHSTALIVDEDRAFAALLGSTLAVEGFAIAHAHDARGALALAERTRFDAAVVDGVARRYDPIALCERLRELEAGTIVVRGTETLELPRVRALARHADARVPLNAGPHEIAERVLAEVSRRALIASAGRIERGDLTIDLAHRRVGRRDRVVALTGFEFDLLVALAREDDLVTREALARALAEFGRKLGDSIDVHVCNLRKKLRAGHDGPNLIQTVRGKGYRFVPTTPAPDR